MIILERRGSTSNAAALYSRTTNHYHYDAFSFDWLIRFDVKDCGIARSVLKFYQALRGFTTTTHSVLKFSERDYLKMRSYSRLHCLLASLATGSEPLLAAT